MKGFILLIVFIFPGLEYSAFSQSNSCLAPQAVLSTPKDQIPQIKLISKLSEIKQLNKNEYSFRMFLHTQITNILNKKKVGDELRGIIADETSNMIVRALKLPEYNREVLREWLGDEHLNLLEEMLIDFNPEKNGNELNLDFFVTLLLNEINKFSNNKKLSSSNLKFICSKLIKAGDFNLLKNYIPNVHLSDSDIWYIINRAPDNPFAYLANAAENQYTLMDELKGMPSSHALVIALRNPEEVSKALQTAKGVMKKYPNAPAWFPCRIIYKAINATDTEQDLLAILAYSGALTSEDFSTWKKFIEDIESNFINLTSKDSAKVNEAKKYFKENNLEIDDFINLLNLLAKRNPVKITQQVKNKILLNVKNEEESFNEMKYIPVNDDNLSLWYEYTFNLNRNIRNYSLLKILSYLDSNGKNEKELKEIINTGKVELSSFTNLSEKTSSLSIYNVNNLNSMELDFLNKIHISLLSSFSSDSYFKNLNLTNAQVRTLASAIVCSTTKKLPDDILYSNLIILKKWFKEDVLLSFLAGKAVDFSLFTSYLKKEINRYAENGFKINEVFFGSFFSHLIQFENVEKFAKEDGLSLNNAFNLMCKYPKQFRKKRINDLTKRRKQLTIVKDNNSLTENTEFEILLTSILYEKFLKYYPDELSRLLSENISRTLIVSLTSDKNAENYITNNRFFSYWIENKRTRQNIRKRNAENLKLESFILRVSEELELYKNNGVELDEKTLEYFASSLVPFSEIKKLAETYNVPLKKTLEYLYKYPSNFSEKISLFSENFNLLLKYDFNDRDAEYIMQKTDKVPESEINNLSILLKAGIIKADEFTWEKYFSTKKILLEDFASISGKETFQGMTEVAISSIIKILGVENGEVFFGLPQLPEHSFVCTGKAGKLELDNPDDYAKKLIETVNKTLLSENFIFPVKNGLDEDIYKKEIYSLSETIVFSFLKAMKPKNILYNIRVYQNEGILSDEDMLNIIFRKKASPLTFEIIANKIIGLLYSYKEKNLSLSKIHTIVRHLIIPEKLANFMEQGGFYSYSDAFYIIRSFSTNIDKGILRINSVINELTEKYGLPQNHAKRLAFRNSKIADITGNPVIDERNRKTIESIKLMNEFGFGGIEIFNHTRRHEIAETLSTLFSDNYEDSQEARELISKNDIPFKSVMDFLRLFNLLPGEDVVGNFLKKELSYDIKKDWVRTPSKFQFYNIFPFIRHKALIRAIRINAVERKVSSIVFPYSFKVKDEHKKININLYKKILRALNETKITPYTLQNHIAAVLSKTLVSLQKSYQNGSSLSHNVNYLLDNFPWIKESDVLDILEGNYTDEIIFNFIKAFLLELRTFLEKGVMLSNKQIVQLAGSLIRYENVNDFMKKNNTSFSLTWALLKNRPVDAEKAISDIRDKLLIEIGVVKTERALKFQRQIMYENLYNLFHYDERIAHSARKYFVKNDLGIIEISKLLKTFLNFTDEQSKELAEIIREDREQLGLVKNLENDDEWNIAGKLLYSLDKDVRQAISKKLFNYSLPYIYERYANNKDSHFKMKSINASYEIDAAIEILTTCIACWDYTYQGDSIPLRVKFNNYLSKSLSYVPFELLIQRLDNDEEKKIIRQIRIFASKFRKKHQKLPNKSHIINFIIYGKESEDDETIPRDTIETAERLYQLYTMSMKSFDAKLIEGNSDSASFGDMYMSDDYSYGENPENILIARENEELEDFYHRAVSQSA